MNTVILRNYANHNNNQYSRIILLMLLLLITICSILTDIVVVGIRIILKEADATKAKEF